MSDPQTTELGVGGAGTLGLELPLGKAFGVQAELGGIALSDGDPPTNPRLADRGAGIALTGMLGLRVQPANIGLWADVNAGAAVTGAAGRFAFDAHAGYDVAFGASRSFAAGPVLGYAQIVQPDDTLRPEDAHILWLGIHVAFGRRPEDPAPRGSVVTAIRRGDRDGDAVFDDEDACIDVPGRRTVDPRTNGCPRGDRDADAVFDDEDACPDEAGPRTADPRTNGCPVADRDGDTVADADDACPDVPGVRTTEPATNGCPPASESVHVEGDRIVIEDVIHFETDSPAVKHASWPLVKQIGDFIRANPAIDAIDIEGHADEVGTEEHNLVLSQARARAVKRLLVRYGVDATRLTTHGFGESRPRKQGHAERSRRENRRVEFNVVHAHAAQATPAPTDPQPGASR